MAIYDVRAPDGSILEIEGPDDATDAQIEAFAAQQFQTPVEEPKYGKAAIGQEVFSNIGETIGNVHSSAARFAGGIYDAVTSPVQTATGLGRAFKGAVQLLPGATIREGEDYRDIARGIGQHYSERYGGMSNLGQTIKQDPVGFMADASVVLGLGAAGLKLAQLPKAAETLSTVSKAVDPVQLAGKAVATVARPVTRQLLGRTTGSGSQVINQAMESKENLAGALGLAPATDDFVKAMRGEVDDLGVVEKAREAFGKMKEARAETYQGQLAKLEQSTQPLNIAPVKAKADQWLKRFGVRQTPEGLDFSRSTLSGQAVNDVKAIYEDLQQWGSKPGDLTPVMVDTLKRRISDFYTENGKARAMIADLSNLTSKTIERAVPEYKTMTHGYEQASKLLRSTEQALLSKNPDAVDTALRKLMLGVREEKGLRRQLMDDLTKFGGEDIQALAAGRVSAPWFTRRLESTVTGATGAIFGSTVSTPMFALIALASPRLAAEATMLLSRTAKAVAKTPRSAYLIPQQASSLSERLNLEQD